MKTLICLLAALLLHLSITWGAIINPPLVTSPITTTITSLTGKAGTCPPPQGSIPLGECSILCQSDNICEGNRKCCKTGCDGYACRVPDDKAGLCPVAVPMNETSCLKAAPCLSDSRCDGDLKCCLTGCNVTACVPPV